MQCQFFTQQKTRSGDVRLCSCLEKEKHFSEIRFAHIFLHQIPKAKVEKPSVMIEIHLFSLDVAISLLLPCILCLQLSILLAVFFRRRKAKQMAKGGSLGQMVVILIPLNVSSPLARPTCAKKVC
jgi:hypothetical protein